MRFWDVQSQSWPGFATYIYLRLIVLCFILCAKYLHTLNYIHKSFRQQMIHLLKVKSFSRPRPRCSGLLSFSSWSSFPYLSSSHCLCCWLCCPHQHPFSSSHLHHLVHPAPDKKTENVLRLIIKFNLPAQFFLSHLWKLTGELYCLRRWETHPRCTAEYSCTSKQNPKNIK